MLLRRMLTVSRKNRWQNIRLPDNFKPPNMTKERLDKAVQSAHNTPGFTDLSHVGGKTVVKPHIEDVAGIFGEFVNSNRQAVMQSETIDVAKRRLEENKAWLKERLDAMGIVLDYSERNKK